MLHGRSPPRPVLRSGQHPAGARRILAELLGVAPDAVALGRLPCPGCGAADHGPPAVLHPRSPFRISLSHASGRCLLAVAQVPVGVDIEVERPVKIDELARVALTATEHRQLLGRPAGAARDRAFPRCWTRKEAALKALGTGIATDLSRIETHPDRRGPVTVTAGPPGTARDWSVHDVTIPGPWVATAAVPHGVSARVTVSRHPGIPASRSALANFPSPFAPVRFPSAQYHVHPPARELPLGRAIVRSSAAHWTRS
ncbi:4'-phosphopantetheinyl transferase superfamily protein [Streptomyces sp. TRM75563]|uniref:4'-phosphopantetheinyl transferase family protein n=1 Tax=Streptomyces sp. TRM75563 TaxID=2817418 RepID=UPI001F60DC9D|nr:4'-phosphopantetheinyl transferase superfamily protein [Streptomyces sp. TRM75563]MCI4041588.1 4'-phosphopantetheinyl transferase superfamily protein [Streptomyces sp. TRM75563]